MLTRLLQAMIRAYQLAVSPLLGDCCRFEPSCSRYCSLCLEHHGAWKGSWLTVKRLARCNPLFKGGLDLPPLPPGAKSVEPNWQRIDQLMSGATRREN
jgi:hypothetical protein